MKMALRGKSVFRGLGGYSIQIRSFTKSSNSSRSWKTGFTSDVREESLNEFTRKTNKASQSMSQKDKFMLQRKHRVGERIFEAVVQELHKGNVPIFRALSQLEKFVLLRVEMTKDCAYASVIWSYSGNASEADLRVIQKRLESYATSPIRGLIGKYVLIKRVPEIRFFYDPVFEPKFDSDTAEREMEKLKDLQKDTRDLLKNVSL